MRRPVLLLLAQTVAIVFTARCVLRLFIAIAAGHSELIYGMWLAPSWVDAVLVVVCAISLVGMYRRDPLGLVSASLPAFIWFTLVAFSPEAWTGWHWIPDGGPREPWGMPPGYSYQFRYTSYEQLVGACASQVVIELLLLILLIMLFASSRTREFYNFKLPRLRQPDAA